MVTPVTFQELQHRFLSTDTHTQKNGCIGIALWDGAWELCVGGDRADLLDSFDSEMQEWEDQLQDMQRKIEEVRQIFN